MSTEVDIASRVWRNIGEDRMMLIAAGVMFYGSAVSSAPPGIRARSVQRQNPWPTGISSDRPLTKISPGSLRS